MLPKSGVTLQGALDSHEIADARHPLLLSHSCQARLGFTKSSRRGTVTLDDYDNQELEVARQIRTGLLMVRIDHLDSERFRSDDMQGLLLDYPEFVDSSDDDDNNDSENDNVSFAAAKKIPPKKFPKETLEAETIIVSCGITNFEQSAYSLRKSTEFGKWLNPKGGSRPSTEPGILDSRNGARERFRKSFSENFPDLVKGREVFLIDCTELGDPDHDKALRSHLGTHPTTLRRIVESEKFPKINNCLLYTSPSPRD